jgi:hypothetical protein
MVDLENCSSLEKRRCSLAVKDCSFYLTIAEFETDRSSTDRRQSFSHSQHFFGWNRQD